MTQYTPRQIIFMIAGIFEAMLAIPVVGWAMVLATLPFTIFAGVGIHVAALIIAKQEGKSSVAPVFGIVASLMAWIPVIGWILHVVTAILYLFEFIVKIDDKEKDKSIEEDQNIRDAEIVEEPAAASAR